MFKLIMKSVPWSSKITVATFGLAFIFSLISTVFSEGSGLLLSLLAVLIFIVIGIIGDTIGLAAATAEESNFHAMASKKIPGAKEAAYISKNAPLFSSFFNDVVGDIAGIVSGAASGAVVFQFAALLKAGDGSPMFIMISVLLTSMIAALTVGGKAVCKTIAIYKSTDIIMLTGKVMHYGKIIKNVVSLKRIRGRKS